VISSSGLVGFSYFNANLYFLSFIPLLVCIIPLYFRNFSKQILALFFLSLVNFLHGYEFVTVYMISAVSIFWFVRIIQNQSFHLRDLLLLSATLITSFIASLGILVASHVLDRKTDLTFSDSTSNIIDRILARNFSENGVPARLSRDFFAEMYRRWTLDGYSFFSLFTFSQLGIACLLIVLIYIRTYKLKKFSSLESALTLFSFGSYFSWYIFGYQHIMWHYMYDWYIFAITIGLGTFLIVMVTLGDLSKKSGEAKSNTSMNS
jgi:hypothetical protein